jgi:hypothetical protein
MNNSNCLRVMAVYLYYNWYNLYNYVQFMYEILDNWYECGNLFIYLYHSLFIPEGLQKHLRYSSETGASEKYLRCFYNPSGMKHEWCVQSTAYQTHFGLCTALITRTLALRPHFTKMTWLLVWEYKIEISIIHQHMQVYLIKKVFQIKKLSLKNRRDRW